MIRQLLGAAIAQAGYYNNTTSTVNSSAWFAGIENMSLPTLGQMATRTLGFVIGTGSTIPGGGTFSGTVITGLVVAGILLGAVSGTKIGAPGGAVIAVVAVFGLISVGLAPAWLKVVLLFLIGLTAAAAILRTSA
jgi:hypothetical protein